MQRILAVTRHTIFGNGIAGYLMIFGFIFVLCSVFVFSTVEAIFDAREISDHDLVSILTVKLFTNLTIFVSYGMMYVAFMFGGSISGEVVTKNVFITLTKIPRWQFCLGVLLSAVLTILVLGSFLLIGTFALSKILSVDVRYVFFVGVLQKISLAFAISGIFLALASVFTVSSKLKTVIFALMYVYFLGDSFAYPFRYLYDIAYFLAPTVSASDLIKEGLVTSRMDFSLNLEIAIIFENFLYTGAMFILVVWGFNRREFASEKIPPQRK